ncbi:MAG: hypothetical protein V3S31_03700 [Dehalococcoidia bacterium]
MSSSSPSTVPSLRPVPPAHLEEVHRLVGTLECYIAAVGGQVILTGDGLTHNIAAARPLAVP